MPTIKRDVRRNRRAVFRVATCLVIGLLGVIYAFGTRFVVL